MFANLKRKLFAIILSVLVPVLIACSSAPVSASAIYNISKDLWCVCGCDIILSECECDTAQQLTGVIKKGLSKGQSDEQVVQELVRQYGQRILIQ